MHGTIAWRGQAWKQFLFFAGKKDVKQQGTRLLSHLLLCTISVRCQNDEPLASGSNPGQDFAVDGRLGANRAAEQSFDMFLSLSLSLEKETECNT
jgi:hypothetical protein